MTINRMTAFNSKRVALFVAAAGMLLSALLIGALEASAQQTSASGGSWASVEPCEAIVWGSSGSISCNDDPTPDIDEDTEEVLKCDTWVQLDAYGDDPVCVDEDLLDEDDPECEYTITGSAVGVDPICVTPVDDPEDEDGDDLTCDEWYILDSLGSQPVCADTDTIVAISAPTTDPGRECEEWVQLNALGSQPVCALWADADDEDDGSDQVSDELLERFQRLQALVERLMTLVEQLRSRDVQNPVGSAVSPRPVGPQVARDSGEEGTFLSYVNDRLIDFERETTRSRAESLCTTFANSDIDQYVRADESFNRVRCTWDGNTIYNDVVASGQARTLNETRAISSESEENETRNASGDPDLAVREAAYHRGSSNVRFTYAIENIGGDSVSEEIGVLLEIDVACDESIEYRPLFTTTLEGETIHSGEYIFGSDGGSVDPLLQGDGCFRLYVDYPEADYDPDGLVSTDGVVDESDEDNNLTGWFVYENPTDSASGS